MTKTMTLDQFRRELLLPSGQKLNAIELFTVLLDEQITAAINHGYSRIQITPMLALRIEKMRGRKYYNPHTKAVEVVKARNFVRVVQSVSLKKAASQLP